MGNGINDYQLDPILPGEKAGSTDYDDSPTSEETLRSGNRIYQDLKAAERGMETDLAQPKQAFPERYDHGPHVGDI